MANLNNDRIPLVLGALATVIGWQSARLTEEIRSTTSVAYTTEIDRFRPGTRTLIIENVSRNKSIKNVEFMLSCPNAAKQCIKRGSVKIRLFPPTIAPSDPTANPPEHTREELEQQVRALEKANMFDGKLSDGEFDEQVQALVESEAAQPVESVSIKATIAAGGKLGIDYELLSGKSTPDFFFIPDEGNALDIYVFDGSSFRGLIIRHFFEIIFTFMLATFAAVLFGAAGFAWLRIGGLAGIRRWRQARKQPTDESGVEATKE